MAHPRLDEMYGLSLNRLAPGRHGQTAIRDDDHGAGAAGELDGESGHGQQEKEKCRGPQHL